VATPEGPKRPLPHPARARSGPASARRRSAASYQLVLTVGANTTARRGQWPAERSSCHAQQHPGSLDGSPTGEAALPYAEALARRSGAALTLVRAAHATSLLGDQGAAQARAIEQAETYLETLAAGLTSRGIRVQTGLPFGWAATWIPEELALRTST
jgi:nucleotide-binding universal stress UspA family protein